MTAAGVPPATEIQESLRHLPAMRLAWLSWRDVWSAVEPIASTHVAAADLAALLVHKGLTYFRGFVGATPRDFRTLVFGRAVRPRTVSRRMSTISQLLPCSCSAFLLDQFEAWAALPNECVFHLSDASCAHVGSSSRIIRFAAVTTIPAEYHKGPVERTLIEVAERLERPS